MTPEELRERSWQFSRRVRRFCTPLYDDMEHEYAARQLRRAAASAASNYRAASIARTVPNFIAKLDIVVEESDESFFWARDLDDAGLKCAELDWILDEAMQLSKIFGSSRRTASRK
jgi:four helix bundle protein